MISVTKHSKLLLGLVLVALVAAGVAFTVEAQIAPDPQAPLPAPQTLKTCTTSMTHTGNLAGVPLRFNTAGPVNFVFGQSFTTSDGRSGVNFSVQGFKSSGEAEGFGPAVLRLDTSRGGSGNYISSTSKANFPGTQRVSFHLVLETGGREYRSLQPAVLVSTGVTSLPPQPGTAYSLVNQVPLEDIAQPGSVSLVLEPGQAAVIGD